MSTSSLVINILDRFGGLQCDSKISHTDYPELGSTLFSPLLSFKRHLRERRLYTSVLIFNIFIIDSNILIDFVESVWNSGYLNLMVKVKNWNVSIYYILFD